MKRFIVIFAILPFFFLPQSTTEVCAGGAECAVVTYPNIPPQCEAGPGEACLCCKLEPGVVCFVL